MGSSFGHLFRISTWGESHGAGVGVVLDGCPPRLALDLDDIQHQLDRRRPGQSHLVSQRHEEDRVEVLSGLSPDGLTLGSPIAMLVRNADARPRDYEEMEGKYRPSHADYTYDAKFGIRALSGGGRSSARETIGRVAAGAIAQQFLRAQFGTEVVAWVSSVQGLTSEVDPLTVNRAEVDATPIRCPDLEATAKMIAHVEAIRKEGDSVGGTMQCVVRGAPPGWGEPVFDKLEADLARALLSLPATKGFEVGSGFAGTRLRGTEHNDAFETDGEGRIVTRTNHSGGIQGGITNGMPILLRVAFKPTATVMRSQDTVTPTGHATTVQGRGRHDPCVLPRAVPMVEAMVALVLADHALRQNALTFP